jgi:predicted  nucleic acid-binding Zn-ribbon protein
MFDSFRQSLRDLMDRSTPPEERRAGLARMKQTLVQARMGLDDLRAGIAATRQRLATEQSELETVRRRKGLAAGINDLETVALAEKYETLHAERTTVLTNKLSAQEAELAMVEREVAEMTAALKAAMSGADTPPPLSSERAEVEEALDGGANVAQEIDALGRASARSAREAEADRLLAELKRRMGK